jgi:hypothetical protein
MWSKLTVHGRSVHGIIRMSDRVLRVVARDPSTKYDIMNV